MFAAVKRNKRLWIVEKETDQAVYTPPDFLQIPNRVAMHNLAFDLNRLGRRDINRIAAFEWEFSKRNVHRTRNCGAVRVSVLEARKVDPEDVRTGWDW